jgi:hypothetical protein
MTPLGRDYYEHPTLNADTARVLDEALVLLGTIRIPSGWLGDGGAEVQLLVSLIAEAERRLPGAVARARDQDYSWAEIGDMLGTTRAAAWQRFAHRASVAHKRTGELLDNPD